MKFAFLVMNELRSINKTINSIYENIINYYNADVFILCQETFDNDLDNINLFNKNVIYKELYKKPNLSTYFKNYEYIKQFDNDVWNKDSCLNMYINFFKMADIIEKYKDDYDYFIFMRTDIEILFPFPNKEIFEKIPNGLYSFDAKYCNSWGGVGFSAFTHKKYILDYLKCCHEIIIDNNKINKFKHLNYLYYNQECLKIFCLSEKNLYYSYIKNINYYYTAETLNDYTTWSEPMIHPIYNVICKYDSQCTEAYENLNIWNNIKVWKFDGENMLL